MSGIQKIELTKIYDECYKRIKEMILCGSIDWGERIDIKTLAKDFGISTFPVVKSIEKLSLEGLVLIYSNRGTFVVSPTENDMREVTESRLVLEPVALRNSFQNNRTGLVSRLKEVERDHEKKDLKIKETESFREFLEYDRNFHASFFQFAENSRLFSFYQIVRSQAELFRTKTFRSENIVGATTMHRQIINELDDGNIDKAIESLKQHIQEVHKETLESC